jgi:hypothetical protein
MVSSVFGEVAHEKFNKDTSTTFFVNGEVNHKHPN